MAHNHDEIIEHYNRFHSAVYGPEGVLVRKTRHLICLGAALGALDRRAADWQKLHYRVGWS